MTTKTPCCPICRKQPPVTQYRPFCSKRCADIDLQGWFSGRYATPAQTAPGDDGEED